jgi:hypothetical protein
MQGKLAISVITLAEVLTGFEGKGRRLARRLLDRFPLLIVDRPSQISQQRCGGRSMEEA